MQQLTLDGYIKNELICCPLSEMYYWIRISNGQTPSVFQDRIHFTLYGYDYLYEDAVGKDAVIQTFTGDVKLISWKVRTTLAD